MRPLTPSQQAEIAERKALVEEHLPEGVVLIKQLFELGMIDGWRSVVSVTFTPGGGPMKARVLPEKISLTGIVLGTRFAAREYPGNDKVLVDQRSIRLN